MLCILPSACGDAQEQALDSESSALTCTTPTAGMLITANTTLCSGNFAMNTGAGSAAITVGANNVQVTCSGTRLVGPGPVGPDVSPNVGFSVVGRSGVKLIGCSASGFQYGALVQNSSTVTLDGTHFDDNYTDPNQGWVQDNVKGGGVRLENVTSSSVKNSSFARNWNGIELRGCAGVTVDKNVADHCTNWGALVTSSNNNTVSNNDFSWAIRGDALSYPNNWYGVDTRDSAAVVIDAGSTGNLIQNNNAQYGGDGIFIRSVIGTCANKNKVVGNTTSYSPHNGIESWCDGGTFTSNTASFCDYGLWLGASDSVTVTGNTANSNKTDGISTQNGEDRHSVIQDNVLSNNGRAGLFLAGGNYQNSNPPVSDGQVWNSSQLLVQRNKITGNASYDIYLGLSRLVTLASNSVSRSKFAEPGTTAVISAFGSYSGASGRLPPTAALATPGTPRIGVATTFDASASKLSTSGGTLDYTWLIQSAGSKFAGGLPPMLFGGSAGSKKTFTFTTPGFYDVDVTVTDGFMGSLASASVPVAPGGVRIGQTASSWTYQCQVGDTSCNGTTFVDDAAGIEGSAVHLNTPAAFDFAMLTPAAKNLNLNASSYGKFGFFLKANDPSPFGWQSGPVIVLNSPGGTITYTPSTILLPTSASAGWIFVEVPLAGGNGWTRSDAGGSLSQVNWVEIHADTWDAGFDIWVDAVSFY